MSSLSSSGSMTVKRRATDSAAVANAITTYRPLLVPAPEWAQCAGFVRDAVQSLKPSDAREAQGAIKTIAPFVAWATRQGVALDREKIFTPDMVERYVAVGCARMTASSRGTVRSNLRRYGRALTRHAPWPPPAGTFGPCPAAPPYSAADVARILEVCGQQRTALLTAQMTTLVALALGAGLSPREMWFATPDDVVVHLDLVCVVTQGTKSRIVPVTAPHDVSLWEVKDRFESQTPFWGVRPRNTTRTRLAHVVADAEVPPGCPPINAHRLRTTWMLRHLDAGLNLAGLARLAGIRSTTTLDHLLAHMAPVADVALFEAAARR